METLEVATASGSALVDITRQVQEVVTRAGLADGVCAIFLPHTTAGLTLNENWDPDVRGDILLTLGDVAPSDPRHRHGEGNSPAHIKASLVGNALTLIVEDGKVQLGTWQGIYLAEFDGPRRRRVWLKMLGGH
jgi:secondary thiamine-phosphate synthase enzyme